MRSAYIVLLCLLLAVIAFGCGSDEEAYGGKSTQGITTSGELRIMTYNVEDCDGGSGLTVNNAHTAIVEIIKAAQSDVVCFQEIQPGSGRNDKYGDGSNASDGDVSDLNRAFIAADYVMPYYAFMNNGSIRRDFVAVWSKIKPDSTVSVFQANGGFDPSTGNRYRSSRPVLRWRIKYNGYSIWFYGMHLKSNSGGVIEQNAGNRRAQAYHLSRYIIRNHNAEKDLIVLLGDMNTMPEDYDAVSLNSTIDYLCMRYDNPGNPNNDFIPVNLNLIGAVTNVPYDVWGNPLHGTTHPGNASGSGYPNATFDHIILSPTAYNDHYKPGSIEIIQKSRRFGGGPADHFPVVLTLDRLN